MPSPAAAQAPCPNICAGTILLRPSVLRSHLFGGPRVTKLSTGAVTTVPQRTNFQVQILATARTAIPRTSLNLSIQWLPNSSAAANPFTEYTASDQGTGIKANTPSVALNASVDLVSAAQTGGWLDLAGYAGDLFSPAARPDDRSDYTHKLDVGLAATFSPFKELKKTDWLHGISTFAVLDYVATGLPRAGDVVPKGERRFDTNARPAAFMAGMSIQVAPFKK